MIPILYEDEALVVVDKPAGMSVHPSPGHETGTVTDLLVRTRPGMRQVGSAERPGVVHRLDVETSGVLVLAKTQGAYLRLRRDFESHERLVKKYLAVLHAAPRTRRGTVDGYLVRRADKKRMRVTDDASAPGAVRALTHWQTLARHHGLALVEFVIETGRMHQIRVHAASLGAPVVGDRLYGDAARDRRLGATRLLLHAVELEFDHPLTHERMKVVAPPPPELVYV